MPWDRASLKVVDGRAKSSGVPTPSDARGTCSDHPPLPEHSMVEALCEIRDRGYIVPKGAIGAVVSVRRDGQVYTVEFDDDAIVSALRSELASIDPPN